MATIIVNTTLDENDGSIADGDVSLRDALALANDGDTITFASGAGEAFENGGTIRLSQDLGELVTASDLNIDGDLNADGAPDVTVTGDTVGDDPLTTDPLGNTITDAADAAIENWADNIRVFNVTGGSSSINGLVITGGRSGDTFDPTAAVSASGVLVAEGAMLVLGNSSVSGNGDEVWGVIGNNGILTITESTISDNDRLLGYAIENQGTCTLTNTTVSNNTGLYGGGIDNGGTASLTNTTVSNNRGIGILNYGNLTLTNTIVEENNNANREGGRGGGIINSGTMTLANTTVSDNVASFGGGIENHGTATLTNTTVSDNRAVGVAFAGGVGGGILNFGNLSLTNVTVSGNDAVQNPYGPQYIGGGGISNSGTATLTNTIVLGNSAANGAEIYGTITENGPNLIGGSAADVFAETVDNDGVAAGRLADNGGAVPTIALKNDVSNPALDAGQDDRLDESVVGIDLNGDGDTDDVIATDARGDGFPRFVDFPGVANNGDNIVDLGAFEAQMAATFEVTTKIDESFDGGTLADEIGDGDGLSLREALALANQFPLTPDTITFASGAGEAFETGGTIRLSQALGELVIASDLNIDGDIDDDGAPDVTITGDTLGDDALTTDPLGNTITDAGKENTADNVRVFNVTGGSSTIDGLVITGGFASSSGDDGGGVHVAEDAALTLTDSSISGNSAQFSGGGIYGRGNLTLINTSVSGNSAYVAGGIQNQGTVTLTNTAVSGNRSDDLGGGIVNGGTVTLSNTTVSGNSAYGSGGGIFNSGNATLTNVTVADNGASGFSGSGGGMYNQGTAILTNTMVSGNFGFGSGGGILNRDGGDATLTNTIVLGNVSAIDPFVPSFGPNEISGTISEDGPNLIGGSAADVFAETVDNNGVAAGLLADNGGAVETIALKNDASNPALDAGRDDRLDESEIRIDLNGDGDTDDVIVTDARGDGFTRFVDFPGVANNGDNIVDLGAYEVQADEASEADCVEVSFVSESAGYQSTYGWYDTETLEARILVPNVDTATNPGLGTFSAGLPLAPDDLKSLGFFLIPDGYNQNANPGEPFANSDGTDLDLEVFNDAGVWKVRDTDSGYVFQGSGNPAYFTDLGMNPGGLDHVMETGDLAADGTVTHAWEDLPDLGDADFDDVVFEVETNYTVEVSFASEDAGYQSTYGWYHTGTGEAEILVANVDTVTNPDLADFTATLSLTADEIEHLGFFLVPDGYNQNGDPGEPFADGDGRDLDLEVVETNGVWQVQDTDTGRLFEGLGAPAYFTEADKNPAGNDHVMEDGDLMADGAVTHNWEDLPGLGDQDFDDVVFDVTLLGCGEPLPEETGPSGLGADELIV